MTIHFRLATPDDIPSLQQLIPLSVRALSAESYTPAQIEAARVHIFGVDAQLAQAVIENAMLNGEVMRLDGGLRMTSR